MSSLIELVTQQLGGGNLQNISQQLGSDDKTTTSAVAAALPLLMGALARNASQSDGAQSLSNALEKDHDGSILNNVAGFLGQSESGPGAGILRHVLGAKQPAAEATVSKATGMNAASVGKLMTMLAPVVMGVLGQQKRQQNLDANGVASMLDHERQEAQRRAPQQAGLLTAFLDSDGDGDVDLGDVAKGGFGIIGKLLGGK
jgi:hypothetical protein